MKNKEITHKDLVIAGKRWLQLTCRVVCDELQTGSRETPDVIGWQGNGTCIVVECKTTRSDYIANNNKSHIRSGNSVGDFKWLLTPQDLINENELYDGWGLLEYIVSNHANGYFLRRKVSATYNIPNFGSFISERKILISVAGRALEACALIKHVHLSNSITEV